MESNQDVEVPYHGKWNYVSAQPHQFLGTINFNGYHCDLYEANLGSGPEIFVKFGPSSNEHRHQPIATIEQYWGNLGRLTSKQHAVKGFIEGYNRYKAGNVVYNHLGVCPKCKTEIKERALFMHTFVGCMC